VVRELLRAGADTLRLNQVRGWATNPWLAPCSSSVPSHLLFHTAVVSDGPGWWPPPPPPPQCCAHFNSHYCARVLSRPPHPCYIQSRACVPAATWCQRLCQPCCTQATPWHHRRWLCPAAGPTTPLPGCLSQTLQTPLDVARIVTAGGLPASEQQEVQHLLHARRLVRARVLLEPA
jgi:hypothetical protein